MPAIYIATSNPGKLHDFAGAARAFGVEVAALPNFASLPPVEEIGETFEANARLKAEAYSHRSEGAIVLADDSGLEVAALSGAPGVRSARYATDEMPLASGTELDEANNAKLLRALQDTPDEKRGARFVCVLAAARDGNTIATFTGEVRGMVLRQERGKNGFGYDPLFFVPEIGKTTAELSAEEKARISHRGAAFRRFLEWHRNFSQGQGRPRMCL